MTESTKHINIGFDEALTKIANTPKSLVNNELEGKAKKADKKIQAGDKQKVTHKK